LMILRAIAQKGQLTEQNAGPMWQNIALPILKEVIIDDGISIFQPQHGGEEEEEAAPAE